MVKSKHQKALAAELKKDPGVPRLPDLRQKLQNRANAQPKKQPGQDAVMASEPTLSSLAMRAAEAEAASSAFRDSADDSPSSGSSPSIGKTKEQIRKYYLKALYKVVDESDIVILVLDARDPEGCRSRLVEEEVLRRGKKLFFVLNKIDLVPRTNVQAWLTHLRHTAPSFPFLASSTSQSQRDNITSSTAPALMKLIKAYRPKSNIVTIGVVGYPNVGKSSLINCLKRSKACAVAAQAGHTKELQTVQLEKGMRVIDSPGVVFDDAFDDGKTQQRSSVLLRNVLKVADVEDPIAVVEEVLVRTTKETLQRIYELPEFNTAIEFLTMIALKTGKLLKGGTPDLNGAARHVLTDWNQQKIPYYTNPPAVHPSLIPSTLRSNRDQIAPGAEDVGKAQILTTGFSKAFELNGVVFNGNEGSGQDGGDDIMLDDTQDDVFFDALEEQQNFDYMDEDGIQMESDDLKHIVPRKRQRSPTLDAESVASGPIASSSTSHRHPLNPTSAPFDTNENDKDTPARFTRPPKRQRKSRGDGLGGIPDAHSENNRTGSSNPLNRKVLKEEKKRARKAVRQAWRADRAKQGEGGMEVDDHDGGLEFTFMVPHGGS